MSNYWIHYLLQHWNHQYNFKKTALIINKNEC